MSNTEMIKELRALTSAGMKDCKDALEETAWDLQKAVDVIKVKGLNIADGRTGRVATDGLVTIVNPQFATPVQLMMEINCQTDFVANSETFKNFVSYAGGELLQAVLAGKTFDISMVESARKEVVASTKENIVVRRWWVEESLSPSVLVFPYLHSNQKIGVLLTLQAPSFEASNSKEFKDLGFDLAMQIAAMNPLAVSMDRLSAEDKSRQEIIFRTQLAEEKKPEKMWDKILEGKFRKWAAESCLLEQESVLVQKSSVEQVIKNVGTKLGGEIKVINFVRCQVGEGIEQKKDNLTEEVAKLM
jgi:elongation factor Ts